MKREERIENKVKHLLRKLGMPRWLHHYGPKTYELYEHLVALITRHYCKGLSYRRTVSLLRMFGIKCPSKSALQRTRIILKRNCKEIKITFPEQMISHNLLNLLSNFS